MQLDWANSGANISPDTPSPTPRASIQYIWLIPVFLGFPIPPNIFHSSKSNNKGDIKQKPQISHLWPQFEP